MRCARTPSSRAARFIGNCCGDCARAVSRGVDEEVIARLVNKAGGEAALDAATVRAAVAELIDLRMVSDAEDCDVDGTVALGPQPILGETAEERFARLPPLPECRRG